ncbi:hypothetical protein FMH16_04205 [Vibrio vulnificus]|nr:hypothetical protein [Vibrio vulnificus]MCU8498769.1 hypothetical protein [Vibrio vulnificus]
MTKIQLTAPNALTKTEDCASPIPHKIHLPWLSASPEAIERNRIVDWANKNPTATIYLWVDSKHFVTEQQSENRFEKNDSEMKTHKRIVKRTPNSMNALMASENQRKRMDVDTVLANFPPKIAAQGYYRSGGVISDLKRFNELANNFKSLSNVQVKDVSSCQDIRMINWDAYQYQVMKKDSRTALVIVRDEILYQYGGVFADATLTCKQPLMFDELLCHERWALLGGMANPNIGKPGKESAFLPEPVIACHPRNIIVKMRIDSVRSEFQNLKKNQILGARYWIHTRPSTDRFRHPLSIKNSVIGALKEYMTEQGLENDHATIISTLSAYCTFPLGYIELI